VASTSGQTAAGQPTAAQIASTAPVPVQDFGATAQVNPTYAQAAAAVAPSQAQAATVDPNQSAAYMQQAYAQNAAALAPTFAQQQSQLQDSSAARGISNSGAAGYLQGNLQGQQASALASADEPITAQGYSYSQADLSQNQANQQATNFANQNANNQVNEYNASNQQAVNSQNAQASNAASDTNAQYYQNNVNADANDYNAYLSALYGSGSGEANSLLSAYLNSFGPNTGVESTINTQEGATANTYNNVYNSAAQQQAQTEQTAALAAGGA
jgi:ABC-type cobalt transport system substrate-binding protein